MNMIHDSKLTCKDVHGCMGFIRYEKVSEVNEAISQIDLVIRESNLDIKAMKYFPFAKSHENTTLTAQNEMRKLRKKKNEIVALQQQIRNGVISHPDTSQKEKLASYGLFFIEFFLNLYKLPEVFFYLL